jgi:hypothetical protein
MKENRENVSPTKDTQFTSPAKGDTLKMPTISISPEKGSQQMNSQKENRKSQQRKQKERAENEENSKSLESPEKDGEKIDTQYL